MSRSGGSLGLTTTRPGNRIAVLGDSTCRGVYSGDSEPGVAGATAYVGGDSWLTWASTLSGGKVNRSRNAGVIGDTIAMMDARVATDIVAAIPRPGACIVYSGYNDAFANVTASSFMTNLASIVGKLRAAGIVPILATPLPTANNAAIGALLARYALAIRKYADDNALILLDFQSWTMAADGGLIAAVKTGGDGVHPSAAGQKWLGQKVSDTLGPLLTTTASPLQISPLDTANIVPNGLFAGAPVNGLAPSVFNYTAMAGTADSVVADALVPGSMQRCTHTASGGVRVTAQRINAAGNWTAGDWVEFSGVITTAGIPAQVEAGWGPPYAQYALALSQDVSRAYYRARLQIPAAWAAGYIDVKMNSGPGTGTADFGQLTVRNLTALGLV